MGYDQIPRRNPVPLATLPSPTPLTVRAIGAWVQKKRQEVRCTDSDEVEALPLRKAVISAREKCLAVLTDGVKRAQGLSADTTVLQAALYDVNETLCKLHDCLPSFTDEEAEEKLLNTLTLDVDAQSVVQLKQSIHFLRDRVINYKKMLDEKTVESSLRLGQLQRKDHVIKYIRATLWSEVVTLREQLYQRDHRGYFDYHNFSIFDFAKLIDTEEQQAQADADRRELMQRLEIAFKDERARLNTWHKAELDRMRKELEDSRELVDDLRESLYSRGPAAMQEKVDEAVRKERDAQQKKLSALLIEVGTLRGVLESKEAVIARHADEWEELVKDTDDEAEKLRSQIADLEKTAQDCRDRSARMKRERDGNARRLADATQQIDSLRQAKQQLWKEWSEKEQLLSDELAQLRSECVVKDSEIVKREAAAEQVKDKVTALEEELSDVVHSRQLAEDRVTVATHKLQQEQNALRNTKEQLGQLLEERTVFQRDKDSIAQKFHGLEREHEKVKMELKLSAQVLVEHRTAAEAKRVQLEERVRECTAEAEKVRDDLAATRSAVAGLKQKNADEAQASADVIARLKESSMRSAEQSAALRRQLDQAKMAQKASLRDMTAEIDSLRNDLGKAQAEAFEAVDKLDGVKRDRERLDDDVRRLRSEQAAHKDEIKSLRERLLSERARGDRGTDKVAALTQRLEALTGTYDKLSAEQADQVRRLEEEVLRLRSDVHKKSNVAKKLEEKAKNLEEALTALQVETGRVPAEEAEEEEEGPDPREQLVAQAREDLQAAKALHMEFLGGVGTKLDRMQHVLSPECMAEEHWHRPGSGGCRPEHPDQLSGLHAAASFHDGFSVSAQRRVVQAIAEFGGCITQPASRAVRAVGAYFPVPIHGIQWGAAAAAAGAAAGVSVSCSTDAVESARKFSGPGTCALDTESAAMAGLVTTTAARKLVSGLPIFHGLLHGSGRGDPPAAVVIGGAPCVGHSEHVRARSGYEDVYEKKRKRFNPSGPQLHLVTAPAPLDIDYRREPLEKKEKRLVRSDSGDDGEEDEEDEEEESTQTASDTSAGGPLEARLGEARLEAMERCVQMVENLTSQRNMLWLQGNQPQRLQAVQSPLSPGRSPRAADWDAASASPRASRQAPKEDVPTLETPVKRRAAASPGTPPTAPDRTSPPPLQPPLPVTEPPPQPATRPPPPPPPPADGQPQQQPARELQPKADAKSPADPPLRTKPADGRPAAAQGSQPQVKADRAKPPPAEAEIKADQRKGPPAPLSLPQQEEGSGLSLQAAGFSDLSSSTATEDTGTVVPLDVSRLPSVAPSERTAPRTQRSQSESRTDAGRTAPRTQTDTGHTAPRTDTGRTAPLTQRAESDAAESEAPFPAALPTSPGSPPPCRRPSSFSAATLRPDCVHQGVQTDSWAPDPPPLTRDCASSPPPPRPQSPPPAERAAEPAEENVRLSALHVPKMRVSVDVPGVDVGRQPSSGSAVRVESRRSVRERAATAADRDEPRYPEAPPAAPLGRPGLLWGGCAGLAQLGDAQGAAAKTNGYSLNRNHHMVDAEPGGSWLQRGVTGGPLPVPAPRGSPRGADPPPSRGSAALGYQPPLYYDTGFEPVALAELAGAQRKAVQNAHELPPRAMVMPAADEAPPPPPQPLQRPPTLRPGSAAARGPLLSPTSHVRGRRVPSASAAHAKARLVAAIAAEKAREMEKAELEKVREPPPPAAQPKPKDPWPMTRQLTAGEGSAKRRQLTPAAATAQPPAAPAREADHGPSPFIDGRGQRSAAEVAEQLFAEQPAQRRLTPPSATPQPITVPRPVKGVVGKLRKTPNVAKWFAAMKVVD